MFLNFVFVFESLALLSLEAESDGEVINSSLEVVALGLLVVEMLSDIPELFGEVIHHRGKSGNLTVESLDLGLLGLKLKGKSIVVSHELIVGSLVLSNDIIGPVDFGITVIGELPEIGTVTIELGTVGVGLLNPVGESLDFGVLLPELGTE